ncbi:nSTAND1 domain-containing NTPase [[Actinomadura] parvosata]|uniref:nSTAND1 domain-containing NTPase n=1 Tax=[Actinomadura] parvosata TaxID=1955412 RepID=UPI00406D3390
MQQQVPGDPPAPAHITTRDEFAAALSRLREDAGISVRALAAAVGGQSGTIGDWLAGRGLPATSSRDLLVKVLRACRVSDDAALEQWLAAWSRVRRQPGPRPAGPEPYRGLNGFGPEHSDWFFGRETVTARVIAELTRSPAPGRPLILVGASGSGKSSLLRAGVAARLAGTGRRVETFTPGARPLAALNAHTRAPGPGPVVLIVDQFEEVFTLCEDAAERRAFIDAVCAAAAAGPVVLGLRADFYAHAMRHPALLAALQDGQITIGPMNERELRDAIEKPALKAGVELEKGLVELVLREVAPPGGGLGEPAPPGGGWGEAAVPGGGLREVAAPGGGAGRAREAHEAGALPLVSHALWATWRKSQGRKLSIAAYQEAGGIEGAVAETADQVYESLTESQRVLARRLFLTLAHIAPDTAITRRRLPLPDLLAELIPAPGDGTQAAEIEDVLDRFVAERLITADADSVRISHEALLSAWPELRSWLEEERAGSAVGRDLAAAAATWDKAHRAPDFLYQGTRLAVARAWAERAGDHTVPGHTAPAETAGRTAPAETAGRTAPTETAGHTATGRTATGRTATGRTATGRTATGRTAISGTASGHTAPAHAVPGRLTREFLAASLAREQAEAEAERRGTRRLRLLAAGLAVLLVFTTAAVVVALRQQRLANQQRDTALSGKVAGDAVALRAGDPALAAQLALAAHRVTPTPESRGALLSALGNPYATVIGAHTDAVYAAEFSPDGRRLASVSLDGTLRMWDVTDRLRPTALATVTGDPAGIAAAAFGPDGRTLVTGGNDNTARLWDVTASGGPTPLATLAGHTKGIIGVAFAPGGRTVATVSYDRTARLWDVADPRRPTLLATLDAGPAPLSAVTFAPDGRTMVVTASTTRISVWDVADPRHPARLPDLTGHTGDVLAAAISRDGRLLATGAFDNTVRLWDFGDPRHVRHLATLTGHGGGVVAIAFAADGRTLATGAYDRTVRLWDVSDPEDADDRDPAVLTGHSGTVYTVAFHPDGASLASGGGDDTVRVWDLRRPILSGQNGGVAALAYRPDGRVLATGSYQKTRLWEVSGPGRARPLAVLTDQPNGVDAIAFSRDGRLMATGSLDFSVALWDVRDPARPRLLKRWDAGTGNVFALALAPDGRTLAVAGERFDVGLWDVADPARPRLLARALGHRDAVHALAFAPRGRVLASAAGDRTVRLWDVADPARPRPLAAVRAHDKKVLALAFRDDGRVLATGGADRTARLWQVDDPSRPVLRATLGAHTDNVTGVAFQPGGRVLATGSDDGTTGLWDVRDPARPLATAVLTGHAGTVNAVAFAPGGTALATGGEDSTVRLWGTDPGRAAHDVCALVFPAITRAEWRRYLPGPQFRPPC